MRVSISHLGGPAFSYCLAGGLPHFMELRNGGPDGPERKRGEQRGGRHCPPNREPSGEAGGHHPSVTPWNEQAGRLGTKEKIPVAYLPLLRPSQQSPKR